MKQFCIFSSKKLFSLASPVHHRPAWCYSVQKLQDHDLQCPCGVCESTAKILWISTGPFIAQSHPQSTRVCSSS